MGVCFQVVLTEKNHCEDAFELCWHSLDVVLNGGGM